MQPSSAQRVQGALLGACGFLLGCRLRHHPAGKSLSLSRRQCPHQCHLPLSSPWSCHEDNEWEVAEKSIGCSSLCPAWTPMHHKQRGGADSPHKKPSSSHVYGIQATQDLQCSQPGFLWNPQNGGCKSKQIWLLVDPNPKGTEQSVGMTSPPTCWGPYTSHPAIHF